MLSLRPRAPRGILARFTTAAAMAGITLGHAAAAGGPPATSMAWVRLPGAESCVEAHGLAVAVERRLGRPAVASPVAAERTIEGRIEPLGPQGGFRASFSISDAAGKVLGTREISSAGADCREMDEDLALVAALLIDPDAVLSAVPPAPTAPPAVSAPVWTAPLLAPPNVAPAPAERLFHVAARGGAVLSVGSLPSLGVGVELGLWLDPPRGFPFELVGVFWTPQRVPSPGGAFGADLWMAVGELSACPLTGRLRGLSWAACAGLGAGMAHVGGFGLDVELAQDVAIAGLALGAQVRRSFAGPLFGMVGVGLRVPFVRLDLYYDAPGGQREVFSTPPVAGTADLALGVEIR